MPPALPFLCFPRMCPFPGGAKMTVFHCPEIYVEIYIGGSLADIQSRSGPPAGCGTWAVLPGSGSVLIAEEVA